MKTLVLIAVLALAGSAWAGDTVEFVRLDPGTDDVARYTGDCTLGNWDHAGAAGYYNDFFEGDESYAALISPVEEGCSCPLGFTVQAVHMALYLPVANLIEARGLLYEAVDTGGGCYEPGGPLATSVIYVMEPWAGPAVYDIEIPLSAPCATPDEHYFVVFEYVPMTTDVGVGVVVDTTPSACTGYDDRDGNWKDSVVERGWVGDFYVWADVDCCEDPVPGGGRSWGALKRLYR